jgi:hypothetical protein
MFYWKVQGRHVVLTDAEEAELLRRAGLTAEERIGFRIRGAGGDELQKRVGKWLEDYARREPRNFELAYVERRGKGPEDLPRLQALVEAYGLTTGRAFWGWPDNISISDSLGAALWLSKRTDAAFITLTRPARRWGRRRHEPTGLLAFSGAEIEKFAGNAEGFVLVTRSMAIRFNSELVRIISIPPSASPATTA